MASLALDRNRGTGGTISDVHAISIVWLLMIGDFQSKGNFPFVPRYRTAVASDETGSRAEARPLQGAEKAASSRRTPKKEPAGSRRYEIRNFPSAPRHRPPAPRHRTAVASDETRSRAEARPLQGAEKAASSRRTPKEEPAGSRRYEIRNFPAVPRHRPGPVLG